MKIYKYELPTSGSIKIGIPYKSQILSVKNQHNNTLVLYALVDPEEEEIQQRTFIVATTGGIEVDSGTHQFIDTVMLANGAYVVHVFEKLPV